MSKIKKKRKKILKVIYKKVKPKDNNSIDKAFDILFNDLGKIMSKECEFEVFSLMSKKYAKI